MAVAAPLPATIPGTLVASIVYIRSHFYDRRIVLWSVRIGLPLTILGAWASQFTAGCALLIVSDLAIAALGMSFIIRPIDHTPGADSQPQAVALIPVMMVAGMVGFVSGLLEWR